MNFETVYCQILGHDNFNTSHICTYQQCYDQYKLLCEMCLHRQSHKHQQKNLDHILKIHDIKEMNNIQLQLKLKQQQKYCEQISQNKILKFSLHCKYSSQRDVHLIQISQNNHLAFGGDYEKIYLINLENNSQLHDIRLKYNLQQFKFSTDSKYLFMTDQQGRFYYYNLMSKKLAYVRRLSQFELMKFIIPINSSSVICSSSTAIYFVKYKQQKIISKFRMKNLKRYPKLNINALAYDMDRDTLIIGSWASNTITILNRYRNNILFQEKIQINLQLDQLLQTDDVLYICGKKQILKYQIDYVSKKIHFLCKFNDASYEKISYFNFTRSIDTIIVVNEEKVLILDINLEIIQTLLHKTQIDLPDYYLQISDLQFLNYLVIPSLRQLMVFKVNDDQQKDKKMKIQHE